LNNARPLKIVINAFSAKLGGGKTYLRNLLARLPDGVAWEIRIFCPDDLPLPPDPRVRREHTSWPTSNPLLRAAWERVVLPRYLNMEKADILFCPGGVVATKAPFGVKVVTMFRNMIPFDTKLVAVMPWGRMRLRNIILKRVMLKSMAEADLTIFISDHARRVIEALRPIPNPRTIPHGISDMFCEHAETPPRPEGAPSHPYILYISRFDVYKHHDNVVAGFAALPTGLREKYKLVFLGETDLAPFKPVRAQISALGLDHAVLIGGAVPHDSLPGWYAHADAIVFASSCENCPNILLESLGAGRPVLSSDVMPMPEFGGPRLAYFSPFDPRSLTAALRETLESPTQAAAIASAARERSRLYNWNVTAEKTWRAIADLAERPN
jgi:glycosyltransferase involved in cell wall biosynthesis